VGGRYGGASRELETCTNGRSDHIYISIYEQSSKEVVKYIKNVGKRI